MAYQEEKIVKMFGKVKSYSLFFCFFVLVGCHATDKKILEKEKADKQLEKTDVETLPYYNTADFTPLWNIDTLKKPIHTIAEFSFKDQDNKLVTNKTFDGKIYVANFFFTACQSICPPMTTNLKVVADKFRDNKDVLFLSHSVLSKADSVKKLKAFAERYKINSSQWHLITGNQDEINTLARKAYFAEEDLGLNKDASEFLHTEHCILIDRQRRIRGVYNGTLQLEMERMAEDIKLLLKE